MPIVPLYGHGELLERLRTAERRGALPASMLLHGPRGVGKQRLALRMAQMLVCSAEGERPCDRCQGCRYAMALTHPDIHWIFPRPRLKDADASSAEVSADYADAIAERAEAGGLYAAPSGTEGIFVATIRSIVQKSAYAPAMARRKVFVLGEAERMVPQEGSEFAANALLKLLEEPPANTVLVLTTSEPGALLPTIRSRVVSVRVPPLPEADVRAFVADPIVRDALDRAGARGDDDELVSRAAGAPGTLLDSHEHDAATTTARRLVTAAETGSRADRFAAALAQGVAGARGGYSDTLDAVTRVLHARARGAAERGDDVAADRASRAAHRVEEAKLMAGGNVNPQLVTAALLADLREELT